MKLHEYYVGDFPAQIYLLDIAPAVQQENRGRISSRRIVSVQEAIQQQQLQIVCNKMLMNTMAMVFTS